MTWASRVRPRPPRRTTNPYPIRFAAVCGMCSGHAIMRAYNLRVAEGAAEWHRNSHPEHADTVEVVPVEVVK